MLGSCFGFLMRLLLLIRHYIRVWRYVYVLFCRFCGGIYKFVEAVLRKLRGLVMLSRVDDGRDFWLSYRILLLERYCCLEWKVGLSGLINRWYLRKIF
jgi:hypothetical protein